MVATTVDPRTRHRATQTYDHVIRYEPFGAALDLFFCTDPEVLLDGPAGTGKSLACLKRLDRNAIKYPDSRQLILRKTRTSLTQSALVTFERQVLIPGGRVRFHTTLQAYLYPNGSIIVVGGLDKDSKVMSSEYDTIYVQEATELTLSDWEALTTRLRNGVIPHQQLIGDCNPGAPGHWLNQRCIAKKTTRLESRHIDNPSLWDRAAKDWTSRGREYIEKLKRLSGVRLIRLLEGKWVSAEGQVFDRWDRQTHLIPRTRLIDIGLDNPRRHIAGVDWGWTNPGVIGVWAIGGDGQMAMVSETYRTKRTNDWWVERAKELQARYDIEAWACDPSEPAYIESFQKAGLNAFGAENAILPGITAVQDRLAVGDDGRARLYILEDALDEIDEALSPDPISIVDEFDSYVWPQNQTGRREKPVDEYNHSCDEMRYVVMHLDGGPAGWSEYDTENMHGWLQSMGAAP